MTQYTTLNHNLERGILRFSEKISKEFSKPLQIFITQMLFGILSCQESKLSCIARSLDEKATLKKVIERLSRNLSSPLVSIAASFRIKVLLPSPASPCKTVSVSGGCFQKNI